MSDRRFASWVVPAVIVVVAALVPGSLSAQGSEPAAEPWTLPRTADGQPDLQGVWDFRTLTPLQRPASQAEKQVLTDEEAADIEARATERTERLNQRSEIRTEPLPVGGNVGAYNNFWFDAGAKVLEDRRTSLIVDPPDGRIPSRLPGVKEQRIGADDGPIDRPVRFRVGGIGTDGPEDRGLAVRCILGFNSGPPITPGGYNQNVQIFQSAGTVAILNEMVHDVRIVPLDGRPQLPEHIRLWMGSSRGRWEGDTLVVETTNFTDKTSSFSPNVVSAVGSGETLHLTERFRRVGEDTLHYEFTVNDPTTFTQPFTAVLLMKKSDLPIYEYACHEGNYGLYNVLAGARAREKAAAAEEAAKSSSD